MGDQSLFLTVSSGKVPAGASFSLDLGSSCFKLVYIKHRNKSEYEANQTGTLEIEFAKFSLEGEADIIDILRREFSPTDVSDQLYLTGLHSSSRIIPEIEKEFQTKANILSEIECMQKGFEFLIRDIPELEAFHPPNGTGLQAAIGMSGQWKKTQTELHGFKETEPNGHSSYTRQHSGDTPLSTRVADIYPCIVATAGSAFCIHLVKSKDSMAMIDISTRSGGTLSGLGQLLLGEKDYSKITNLASEGDESKVTTYFKDLKKDYFQNDGGSNPYASIPDTLMCFSFMKASQENPDFTKADLARALVYMLTEDMAQLSFWTSQLYNCKHVFVNGGMTAHEVVREAFTRQFYQRAMANNSDCGLYFIKPGQYMGALGALLSPKSNQSDH